MASVSPSLFDSRQMNRGNRSLMTVVYSDKMSIFIWKGGCRVRQSGSWIRALSYFFLATIYIRTFVLHGRKQSVLLWQEVCLCKLRRVLPHSYDLTSWTEGRTRGLASMVHWSTHMSSSTIRDQNRRHLVLGLPPNDQACRRKLPLPSVNLVATGMTD